MIMKTICLSILLAVLAACGNGAKVTSTEVQQSASDSIDISKEQSESEETEEDHVCVSEDGRVRIKAGIHPDGGTSPDYWARWTIIDDKGEKHERTFEYTSYMSGVHAIHKSDGSTYYIVNCSGKASSTDGSDWLEAYRIVGDSIKKVNVIDGGSEVGNRDFYINYYIPGWYFTTNGAGYDWLFEYDKETRNLYVPIVEERCILDHYQVWHFNGDRFVCMGEQPHKNMHESLGAYNRLMCYFKTKDYIVRVDLLDSHELRYASWKRPKTMADSPDLIITGGRRQEYWVGPDELRPCADYRFTHGSYEYIVNYCETKLIEDGSGEHHDYLLVKTGDKVIVKQEKELD